MSEWGRLDMRWLGCAYSVDLFIVGIGVFGSGNMGDRVRESGLKGDCSEL